MSFITSKVSKFQKSGIIPDQTKVKRNIHTNKPVITPYEEWLKQRDQKKNVSEIAKKVQQEQAYTKKTSEVRTDPKTKKTVVQNVPLKPTISPIDIVTGGVGLQYSGGTKLVSAGLSLLNPLPISFKGIRNAFNISKFKPNPEAYYRMLGKDGYSDALQSGVLRSNPSGAFANRATYYTKGKLNDKLNPVIGGNVRKGTYYEGPYMAEVTPGKQFPTTAEKLNSSWNFGKTYEPISISEDNVRLFKQHWLRGYKEVPKTLDNTKQLGFFNPKGAFQRYPKGPVTPEEVTAFRNHPWYKKSLEFDEPHVGMPWYKGNYYENELQGALKGGNRDLVNKVLYGGRNWRASHYIMAGVAGSAYPSVAGLYGLAMSPPAVKNKVLKNAGISDPRDYGFLSSKDTTIDLTNRDLSYAKINEVKDGTVILGGEFIESMNNSVRKAKDWLNANDTYGDKKLPTKDITSFYGVENDKFKVGKADQFNPDTEIVPMRFGNRGIKEAILRENGEMRLLDSANLPIYQNTPNTGKFILYSPQTKQSEFNYINNGQVGVKKVNDFLKRNKSAQYIVLDNGRYEYYGINPSGLTSSDFQSYYEQDLKRKGNPGYNLIIKKQGGIIKFQNSGKFLQTPIDNTKYIIQPGDTLSKLSQIYKISQDELAKLNNIQDPNKIFAGKTLDIPKQYTEELQLKNIPQSHHPHRVINNFSPNYDYLVQGDKLYYKVKKGEYWADISANTKAKKNIYEFLKSKYDLKGYTPEEQSIWEMLNKGTYNYDTRYTTPKTPVTPKAPNKAPNQTPLKTAATPPLDLNRVGPLAPVSKPKHWSEGNASYRMTPQRTPSIPEQPNPYIQTLTKAVTQPVTAAQNITKNILDVGELGMNWVKRQQELNTDEREPNTQFNPTPIVLDSQYDFRLPQITGDTIRLSKDQYYLPEVIDLTKVKLGARSRGDYTPIQSDAAIATTFSGFGSKKDYVTKNKVDPNHSFIGINARGEFKHGSIDQFDDQDVITKTFKNTIIDFVRDAQGNIVYDQRNKNNPNKRVPLVQVKQPDGKIVEGSLNVLTKRGKPDEGTYGNITGGRMIMQAGNEIKLVSGSMIDIEREFKDLKQRYPEVNFYTLDNGTFSKGLRTYDRKFTGPKLRSYDNSHASGGNFLYLAGDGTPEKKFKETIYQTPNIRTEKDESFKKGHPLENEQKAVVLHHTAYEDPNLTNVHNYFMTPGKNSAHVLIGYDGERRVYGQPNQVTFHAGTSKFKGRDNVNDFGIGIEFQGNTSNKRLTKEQLESAVEYLYPIVLNQKIPLENIVSHAMISGKRKEEDINMIDYNNIVTMLKERIYKQKSPITYNSTQVAKKQQGGNLFQTNKPAFVDSVLNANSDLEWVKRLYPTMRRNNSIENIIPGQRSTHLMSNNGQGYVFPKIVKDKGTLKYLPTDDQAGEYARQTNTGIQFKTPEQGAWFSENYKIGTGVFGKNPKPSTVYKTGGIINYKTK